MTTPQKYLPYDPQTPVVGQVGPGLNLAYHIEVPSDAAPGSVGSVSLSEYGDAPFNACVGLFPTNDNFTGHYALVSRTCYFQIATTPPNPHPEPGTYQVGAGEAMFLTVSIAHDGKQGGGNWPGPKSVRAECRAAR
jgi:hypothetical protein